MAFSCLYTGLRVLGLLSSFSAVGLGFRAFRVCFQLLWLARCQGFWCTYTRARVCVCVCKCKGARDEFRVCIASLVRPCIYLCFILAVFQNWGTSAGIASNQQDRPSHKDTQKIQEWDIVHMKTHVCTSAIRENTAELSTTTPPGPQPNSPKLHDAQT